MTQPLLFLIFPVHRRHCRDQNCSGPFLLSLDSSHQKSWASRAIWDSCCQAVLLVLFSIHSSLEWAGYYDNGHQRNIYEFCPECRMWFFSQCKIIKLIKLIWIPPPFLFQPVFPRCLFLESRDPYLCLPVPWEIQHTTGRAWCDEHTAQQDLAWHCTVQKRSSFAHSYVTKSDFQGETRSPVYSK